MGEREDTIVQDTFTEESHQLGNPRHVLVLDNRFVVSVALRSSQVRSSGYSRFAHLVSQHREGLRWRMYVLTVYMMQTAVKKALLFRVLSISQPVTPHTSKMKGSKTAWRTQELSVW